MFLGAFPIGDSDPQRVPIKDVGPAVAYYTQVLGFRLVERQETAAVLQRDDARIRLEQNNLDPEQVSLYFSVDKVEPVRAELLAKLAEPSEFRIDEYNGQRYQVFFVKEPYGVCFCIGQTLP